MLRYRFTFVSSLSIVLVCSLFGACSNKTTEDNWNNTVNKVSSGVVSIQVDAPMSFDGNWNFSKVATGFVVDAERGIILTNRHVVTPGPVSAKAVLINNEEIVLHPLYFDPVHDFGFFKYDPKDIKRIRPHQFVLNDAALDIGEAIRIIGNDAGQKISILDGTISRLDREAPVYGKGRYNDFNTFYIQAATSTSGGSSGSPVINIRGEVVALNAGSQERSATAFYLPLEKVKLALETLQQGQSIERGSLQTTFVSTTYAELKRLGLSDELENRYREKYPDLKGLLVVRKLIPGSGAAEQLNVGDILLNVNQQSTATFSELEDMLNKHVGESIELSFVRRGEVRTARVVVDDLHMLTPSSLVKFDGSLFHTVSYQQARHFNRPIKGAYVAVSSSYFQKAGIPDKSVIVEFNGHKIDTVEDLNQALREVDSGKKVNVRYYDFSTPNTTGYALVEISRKWFEHSYCQWQKTLSYWPCEEFTAQDSATEPSIKQVPKPESSGRLEDSLVQVKYYAPYATQGHSNNRSGSGTGVIVDMAKGWVVVPRSVVSSILGEVKLIFNNRYEVRAKIEYVHPLHNLAMVSYRPADAVEARISEAVFSTKPMQAGDPILQVGLNYDGELEYRRTEVDITTEFWLRKFNVPQYVDTNLQATHFANPNDTIDGILVNADNEVAGLWIVFDASAQDGKKVSNSIAGLASEYVLSLIDSVNKKAPIYSLDIELTQIAPVDAIQMGLDESWLNKIIQGQPKQNKVLAIYNVSTSSNSAAFLKRGDLLLAINGTPISSFRQAEQLSQSEQVVVSYFSQGEVKTETIATQALYGVDIDRVLFWSGLYLHSPHRAAQLQGNVDAQGVYVASYRYGSPASRYGLYAVRRIVEVDGAEINDVDDFIAAVKDKAHLASVIIKTIDFNNTSEVITLKVNNQYWPFYELRYQDGDWVKKKYPLSLESI